VPTWVALLRAVNLGARNKVSMPALRTALTEAGFTDVRTYVQSGNIVLDSALRSPAKVGQAVRDVVLACSGVDTPVVVRRGRELAEVLAWNPFPAAAAERPKLVQVVHLAATPAPAAVAAVLAADVGPDEVAVRGREMVVAYHETTRNNRTDQVLRTIGVDGTARNWRTLTALVEMTR
jgi:uncharacterized protein (DUF1697 family)